MLTNSFIHIQGIGEITEKRLWEHGLQSWDAHLPDDRIPISAARQSILKDSLAESRFYLGQNDPTFFAGRLPSNQVWRLFPEFRASTVYLDIETTGLERPYAAITTIGLYDGQTIKTYVAGQNLDDFVTDIQNYKVIVSYNGRCFDIPFIEDFFSIKLHQAHIDLRYVLSSLGYKGGLKGCERQLGLDRGDLSGVDGFFAVLLWHDYRRNGNDRALETLLAYNVQDTVTLATLMQIAYNLKIEQTPFRELRRLPQTNLPQNPFTADRQTIDRIKYSAGFSYAADG